MWSMVIHVTRFKEQNPGLSEVVVSVCVLWFQAAAVYNVRSWQNDEEVRERDTYSIVIL